MGIATPSAARRRRLLLPAAALGVIGPVFVHGIASRTLTGLGAAAERGA